MKPYYDRVEELHRRERKRRRLSAVSRRRLSAGDAAQLRRDHLHRGVQKSGLAVDASAPRAADASAQWPAGVPLLRQLRERLRRRRDVQPDCGHTPPALQTGKLEIRTDSVVAQMRMNRENRAQGVTYIERNTMKSVDVEARWVILAASTLENTRLLLLSAKGGLGEFQRHARPVHDGPGGRRRRERHPAEVERRTEPARRRQAGGDHDSEFSEHRSRRRSGRTSFAAT